MAEIWVGKLPGRKRQALSINRDGVIEVLAYFVSETAAEDFLKIAENGLRFND